MARSLLMGRRKTGSLMNKRNLLFLLPLLAFTACADDQGRDGEFEPGIDASNEERSPVYRYLLGHDGEEAVTGGAHWVRRPEELRGNREKIDSANRGDRLHHELSDKEYTTFDPSNTTGETDWDVFASNWWPQSKNGTAWRWQPGAPQSYDDLSDAARLSPIEKYDLMFNPGQTKEVEAVSHCRYREAVEDAENCDKIDHPAVTVAGPATKWELENQGTYQQYEPEGWWGHCNGWASYVTAEPLGAPERDISVKLVEGELVECVDTNEDGCTFWKAGDIEALMTELYFSDQATFSGRRCNANPDDLEVDEYGRPVETACRDLNPGSFHIAITGLLGKGATNLVTKEKGRPAFIIDHNADWEVWNFPIVRFEISDQEEVSEERANELIGATGSDYEFNSSAKKFVRVKLEYWMVSDGVSQSEMMKVASDRNVQPHQVELNYVLELDNKDVILGGEWIESPVALGPDNKKLHPDFMWMAIDPTGYGEGSDDQGGDDDNPHVRYSKVKSLLECANKPETCAPAATDPEPGDEDPAPSGPTCTDICGSSSPAEGSSPACYCDTARAPARARARARARAPARARARAR